MADLYKTMILPERGAMNILSEPGPGMDHNQVIIKKFRLP